MLLIIIIIHARGDILLTILKSTLFRSYRLYETKSKKRNKYRMINYIFIGTSTVSLTSLGRMNAAHLLQSVLDFTVPIRK